MQLSRRARAPGAKKRGFLTTGAEIVKRETPLGLYKGLGAVVTGIVPKMAIRFTSFEAYKQLLADDKGHVSGRATFLGEFYPRSFSSFHNGIYGPKHSGNQCLVSKFKVRVRIAGLPCLAHSIEQFVKT